MPETAAPMRKPLDVFRMEVISAIFITTIRPGFTLPASASAPEGQVPLVTWAAPAGGGKCADRLVERFQAPNIGVPSHRFLSVSLGRTLHGRWPYGWPAG